MRSARNLRLLALMGVLALARTAGAAPAEECGKAPPEDKASCYERALDKVLAEQGTEAALTALKRYTKGDPVALREAHPLVHHIGRRSFAFYKDARVAMSHCRDTFWSGCYHGVLEGYLAACPRSSRGTSYRSARSRAILNAACSRNTTVSMAWAMASPSTSSTMS